MIMDYKDRYNRLLDAIKELQEANPSDEGIQNWINDNVPELCESEDERIRKGIISGMTALKEQGKDTFATVPINDCIAWLEKQGEQKPAWSEEDERYLNTTIAYLKDAKEFKKTAENCIDWLKSLKQRLK